MPRDFFDPTAEQQKVTLIDAATFREAERPIESCEHCNLTAAEIPFDWILDHISGLRSQRDGLHSRSASQVSELSAWNFGKDTH